MSEGTVIIIGGAEDKVRDRVILNRFVSLAGGTDARIMVISTASSLGAEAGERYRAIFTELGVTSIRTLHAVTRAQANEEKTALIARDATGIFLTGGNQLRLSSTIGGTRLADAILDRFRHGAVVAGTSAGASAMSSHMIAFGASGATPKQRMAQIAAGLGVLPGVIVDQHFQQRNRLGRLLSLIAQNPSLLGLGVDEDTAGVVGPDHVLEVIGRGSITIVDGTTSETDAWEVSDADVHTRRGRCRTRCRTRLQRDDGAATRWLCTPLRNPLPEPTAGGRPAHLRIRASTPSR